MDDRENCVALFIKGWGSNIKKSDYAEEEYGASTGGDNSQLETKVEQYFNTSIKPAILEILSRSKQKLNANKPANTPDLFIDRVFIIWDGDIYEEEKFTYIIPYIAASLIVMGYSVTISAVKEQRNLNNIKKAENESTFRELLEKLEYIVEKYIVSYENKLESHYAQFEMDTDFAKKYKYGAWGAYTVKRAFQTPLIANLPKANSSTVLNQNPYNRLIGFNEVKQQLIGHNEKFLFIIGGGDTLKQEILCSGNSWGMAPDRVHIFSLTRKNRTDNQAIGNSDTLKRLLQEAVDADYVMTDILEHYDNLLQQLGSEGEDTTSTEARKRLWNRGNMWWKAGSFVKHKPTRRHNTHNRHNTRLRRRNTRLRRRNTRFRRRNTRTTRRR